MPFGGPQIFMEFVGFDAGDDEWHGSWAETRRIISERLTSFKFETHETKKDLCVLTLQNEDFSLLDAPCFARGQKFIVSWGWPGRMSVPRRMIVVAVNRGDPIEVRMHCTLELLDLRKTYRREEGLTDSQYVRKVAESWGYTGTMLNVEETTEVNEVIVQPANFTDARFLAKLAKQNGFVFYIDGFGLHWHSRRTGSSPVKEYFYKNDMGQGDILEKPTVEYDPMKSATKVKVAGRDPKTGEPVVASAGMDDTGQPCLGGEDEQGDVPDAWEEWLKESILIPPANTPNSNWQGTQISQLEALGMLTNRQARSMRIDIRDGGLMTSPRAYAIAKARMRDLASRRYKVKLSVIGDSAVSANTVVRLTGIADVADGLYYVESCSDEITAGSYTQSIGLQRDAPKKASTATKKTNPNQNPGSSTSDPVGPDGTKLEEQFVLGYGPDGTAVMAVRYVDPKSKSVYSQREATYTDVGTRIGESGERVSREDQEAIINAMNQCVLPDV